MFRFGKRVSRAFSFSRTPRKMKRALSSMSQMMSPLLPNSQGAAGGANGGGAAVAAAAGAAGTLPAVPQAGTSGRRDSFFASLTPRRGSTLRPGMAASVMDLTTVSFDDIGFLLCVWFAFITI